jgi:F0F1-type ATP synthase assembly protein I
MSNYLRERRRMLGIQAKVVAALVLVLSVVAWWKQGLLRALVGGAILYAFLVSIILISSYFENRRKRIK